MNKLLLALSGLLGLQALPGCAPEYPQYSGKYQLNNEATYSDPSFAGEKRLPWDLTITHRMKYIANTWDDRLRFEFTPQNPETEITGAVVFDLENLTRAEESSFPHEYFKGELIYAEKKYYGGAFCNSQYQYHAFAVLIPGGDELAKVYPERGEHLYTENGLPVHETFNPDEFEPDKDAICGWYDAIEQNGGVITLDFLISRNIKDTRTGCDEDSYLPMTIEGGNR